MANKTTKVETPADAEITEGIAEDTAAAPPPGEIEKPSAKDTEPTEKTAEEKGGFCVYLGPSIHGVILGGTVFGADKKATLAEIESTVKAYPLVAALIAPGDTLPESRIKVKTPGNLLYENYRKLAGRITTK